MNRLAIIVLVSVILLAPFLINDAEAKEVIVKPVDEIVNNSVVLQDDDDFFFTCDANTVYFFKLTIFGDFPFNPDFNSAWTIPTGATGQQTRSDINSGVQGLMESVTDGFFLSGDGAGVVAHTFIEGRIQVGSTAGTCQWQWAQDSPEVSDTKVLAGSSLEVYQGGRTLTGVNGLAFAQVTKAVDETVTNSITLQDDDELKVTLSANKAYSFISFIFASAVSTAPDIKLAWTIPSGATGDKNPDGTAWNGFSFVDNITTEFDTDLSTGIFVTEIHGRVNMGSTAGDLQLTWSQKNTSADATIVLAGSSLKVWEEGTTLASAKGEKGDKGDKGDTGATGARGADGAGGGAGVGSPPAPVVSEADLVQLVLAELQPLETTILTPVESVVQTFFEFAVIDTSHDQLVLNSFLANERLGIRWSSGQDITLISATPASSPFTINFEPFPVVKQGSGAVISTDFLIYSLQVPDVRCTNTVRTDCVENVRYEIPVTINAVLGDTQFTDTGSITVDLTEDAFDPILLLILSMFFIPAGGFVIQKLRGRSGRIPLRRITSG